VTTRPGTAALDSLRLTRGKRLANLVGIIRTDGVRVLLTDHDRPLTFEGQTYTPAVVAGLSAERREASLRPGNQEARGLVDGSRITLTDLQGNRFRGAEVRVVRVEWDRPWVVHARHRKWIRTIVRSGSSWVGTLEGRSQMMQRPSGGRFGGTFTTTCPYQLGGAYCGVDTAPDALVPFSTAGARVDSITTQRRTVAFDTGTVGGSYGDDYFRDGSIQWIWSAPEFESQTTATSTATGLTDSAAAWTTDEHVGKWVRFLTASGAGVDNASYARITANTATTLTFDAISDTYASGTYYDVCGDAANFGEVSEIVSYANSTRTIEMLLPTPFDIAVGDSGVLYAGCDGLRTTCRDKFNNVIRFGGDPFAPSSGQVIEPPINQ